MYYAFIFLFIHVFIYSYIYYFFPYIYDISYIYIYLFITNSHKYVTTANLNNHFGHFKPFLAVLLEQLQQFSYCWCDNLCNV